MAVIIQPKRILIEEFVDDNATRKFFRFINVAKQGFYGEIVGEWSAAYEVIYNGKPHIAVPRRFNPDFLDDIISEDQEFIKDKFITPFDRIEFKFNAKPRNDIQRDIESFLLGTGRYTKLAKGSRRALFANTGTGKTFSTLNFIHTKGIRSFILCPDEKALKTWKDEIAKFTDIQTKEIFVIKGRESLAKFLKKKDDYKIVLGSSKTFSSLFINKNFTEVEDFFNNAGIGIMIYDEVHLNLMVTFFLEMIVGSRYTLYLTATPSRRIYKENKILESLFPSESFVYTEPKEPRFEYYSLKYYSNLEKSDYSGIFMPKGTIYSKYSQKVLFNTKNKFSKQFEEEILPYIIKLAASKLTAKHHKIAFLCSTKEENYTIAEMIKKRFKKLEIGMFNSDIENMEERFQQTNAKLIMSTDKSFAGIINIPDLEVIINLYPYSGESHILQMAGRLRKDPNRKSIFMQMADISCKRFANNARSSKQNFEEEILLEEELYLNDKQSKFSQEEDD